MVLEQVTNLEAQGARRSRSLCCARTKPGPNTRLRGVGSIQYTPRGDKKEESKRNLQHTVPSMAFIRQNYCQQRLEGIH